LPPAGTGRELSGSGASGSGSGDVGEDMHHLSFGRKEEGGLGTRIPSIELIFEYQTNLFSMT
jgi:hypothetical protein